MSEFINTTADAVSDRKPTVVFGVTGCIAAYKSAEIVRRLTSGGINVKAIMTEAATRFLGPLTLRTLTGNPVVTSLWDDPATAVVHHVSLAQEADVLLIAPCTANVLAKLAAGYADDMLTTTALATTAPIIIAPAMNTRMWRAEATRANIDILRKRGVIFVEPAHGELACGEIGEGRLASLEEIELAVRAEIERSRDLEGLTVLVTAGPTYEALDPVRFLGNRSSGLTGYLIAEEAARRGAEVVLVSGPTALPEPYGVTLVRVESAEEMLAAALTANERADVVIAAAAVADYRPSRRVEQKIKKSEEQFSLELVRNPDVLQALAASKGDRFIVGFAAETSDIIENARKKLNSKSLDMVVANDVSDPRIGFCTADNRVVFVYPIGESVLPLLPKKVIARELIDVVSAKFRGKAG